MKKKNSKPKRTKKFFLVAGARPNFVKIAALSRAFNKLAQKQKKRPFEVALVNTGQHYDYLMSRRFFEDLDIPRAKFNLNVGSGSHALQTAKVMVAFEKLLFVEKPDLVLVVGDVNSTIACTLVASKLNIPVVHVEAGLRSRDRTMPEEINRLVTDVLADTLFTTSADANINLIAEGISKRKIFLTGNVMIDSLLVGLKKIKKSNIKKRIEINDREKYILMTLHRPGNVDNNKEFYAIMQAVGDLQKSVTVVFPIHPRTKKLLAKSQWRDRLTTWKNLKLIDPLGYLDFIALMKDAALVMTDSGGVQEETTFLKVPCLTLRDNTERPVTITHGTNRLVERSSIKIVAEALRILNRKKQRKTRVPPLWDGKSAERIARITWKKYMACS